MKTKELKKNQIGKVIPISENASYEGQDMEWTEEMSEPIFLQQDLKVYHQSNHKIKAFYPKEICTFTSLIKGNGYFYAMILPKGTKIRYSANVDNPYTYRAEVRVDLGQNKNIKIHYIGNMEKTGTYIKNNVRYSEYKENIIEF